ncbi:PAS domain S-box protein [Methyloligella sp. 2.7D]|uniref:hybrid sensor histidine kinase/response regulator n=1 Tax=unclassified Methyloligella TaxID=2625955 RepID=UPI00157D6589|nr:PAS domain-containing sensor histidine kinase [Methyloligella sp. GL2]QKP78370.1 PAS domain S-box protein [Methyloligella sp. GL2]
MTNHGNGSIKEKLNTEMLLDAVVDYAIYMLDRDGYISSWNAGAERIKGYTAEQALGQHFSRFFTPEDQTNGKPKMALAIASRTGRHEEEGWRIRRDGSRFYAQTVLDAIRDEKGEVIGFVKITRDMSERHAAEQALLASERRFRFLVDAVSDYAIFMLDMKGNISNWNKGAERIKGYKTHEVLGRHVSMFYTAEEQEEDKPQQALAAALREGHYEAQGLRVRKDGSTFWANVVIQPVQDDEGRIVGFAKVTRDITQQHEAEQAMELAREELHQAQKMEALGHLTGGVAHDFNNFLTAIVANLELIRAKTGAAPQLAGPIEAALQAAEDGAAVVRQMAIFARKQPLKIIPTDINETVTEIASLIRRSGHENIKLDYRLADDLRPAATDPGQLQTGILNLALNACDAMPYGGLLTIATENCDIGEHERLAPGKYVCISVTDTGEGMCADVLCHAFDPFFTTKELGKGTGLGLSMVYGAMQQLGGDAAIDSEPGVGTTVRLILPAADRGDMPKSKPVQSPEKQAPVPEEPLHLLYVEDDFLVGIATVEILENAGMRVHNAAGAEEALSILEDHPEIDLLLTDIGLPGMSGHELVAEARRRHPELKVLFLTGYDRTGPIVGTEADDNTQYMGKPYEPSMLLSTIHGLTASP